MSTRSSDRQTTYRDLRERAKRRERGREESLQRLLDLLRERPLHMFPSRDAALGPDAWD